MLFFIKKSKKYKKLNYDFCLVYFKDNLIYFYKKIKKTTIQKH